MGEGHVTCEADLPDRHQTLLITAQQQQENTWNWQSGGKPVPLGEDSLYTNKQPLDDSGSLVVERVSIGTGPPPLLT